MACPRCPISPIRRKTCYSPCERGCCEVNPPQPIYAALSRVTPVAQTVELLDRK
jgi:hypothetical protein